MHNPARHVGLAILLYVPRLFLILAVLLGMYALLWRDRQGQAPQWAWTQSAWAALMTISALLAARSAFHLQQAVRQEYAFRVPLATNSLLMASPMVAGSAIDYLAQTEN